MQYLIIERFKQGKVKQVYERFEEQGRLNPHGLHFLNSWITEDVAVCYQVMETDDRNKLNQWMDAWSDLVDFEVIAVITSGQARKIIFESDK